MQQRGETILFCIALTMSHSILLKTVLPSASRRQLSLGSPQSQVSDSHSPSLIPHYSPASQCGCACSAAGRVVPLAPDLPGPQLSIRATGWEPDHTLTPFRFGALARASLLLSGLRHPAVSSEQGTHFKHTCAKSSLDLCSTPKLSTQEGTVSCFPSCREND